MRVIKYQPEIVLQFNGGEVQVYVDSQLKEQSINIPLEHVPAVAEAMMSLFKEINE